MTTKTPSNQGGSSSGISDVKYQKAIKQISKLITLNTSIKNQHTKLQQKFDKLQAEYDCLEQKYNTLEFQCKKFKNFNGQSTDSYNELPFIETRQSRLFKENETSQQLTNFVENSRKQEQLEARLLDKQEKIIKLKNQLEQRKQQIESLQNKNNNLNQEIVNLKANQVLSVQYQLNEKQTVKLKKQLQKSEQLIKKMSLDYQLLKKQLDFNSSESINTKSIQINVSKPIESGKDPLSNYYLDSLKKIQTQNIKLKKQLNEQKKRFKVQIQMLKNEKQTQLKKLLNLANFAEKQHIFIQKLLVNQKPEHIFEHA